MFDKMILVAILVIVAHTFGAKACSAADAGEKVAAVAAFTALSIDWMQTRYIAKHPGQFQELNPILGEHPSVGRVNTYFAGAIIGTALVAYALPEKYRTPFLTGVAFLEIGVTARNYSVGIGMSF